MNIHKPIYRLELTNLDFQIDIPLEKRLLGTHPNRGSENLTSSRQLESPDLEFGEHKPQFGECELFVWNELNGSLVYFSRPFVVLRGFLGRVTSEL